MWSSDGRYDWTNIFDTWKSTKKRRALPLKLDDDYVHYLGNVNNFSASFYCMYFFKIVLVSYSIQNHQYKFFLLKCCKKV